MVMMANIKRIITGLIVSVAIVGIVPFAVTSAQPSAPASPASGTNSTGNQCGNGSIFPTWYDGLCENGRIKSPAQMSGSNTGEKLGRWIGTIALNIVAILLMVVGFVSLGFIIVGGFKYMTQGDNSSGVSAAKKTITNAVVGLILSIMSVAIVKFIAGAVGG